MNRTIREAIVTRYQYGTHKRFEMHVINFIDAYSYVRQLRTLRNFILYDVACEARADQHQRVAAI